MISRPKVSSILSEFLVYLSDHSRQGNQEVPPLTEISKELGISVSSVREQLQVARTLGFVEVKPKLGIKLQTYSFEPTISQSLSYAVSLDLSYFEAFSDLRNHIETSYWYSAVSLLTMENIEYLRNLIITAKKKLSSTPLEFPHQEHRDLHLSIYKNLENPFVTGILEAYWNLYEIVGLNVYVEKSYLEQVWNYHEQMVDAIAKGDYAISYQTLITHMDLIHNRKQYEMKSMFE